MTSSIYGYLHGVLVNGIYPPPVFPLQNTNLANLVFINYIFHISYLESKVLSRLPTLLL